MNLIPDDYTRYLSQMQILQRSGVLLMIFVITSLVASLAFNYKSEQFQKEIVVLEHKKAISSLQRNQLKALQSDHDNLVGKRDVLEKLRGGALAESMFVTVDRALDGNSVWFKSWYFNRAGSKTNEAEKVGVNTGYFIVIPESDAGRKKAREAWKIQTHMEVDGEARDHEALSSFVRRLLQQPQIADVRILNTQQQIQADITVVNFKLAITVNTRVMSS